MNRSNRKLALGVILIGLGLWVLTLQLFPSLDALINNRLNWPWQLGIFAGLFIVTALVAGLPGLMIPGSILGGIAGILMYTNQTGNWAAWSYLWTLIPGFSGLGLILFGLARRRSRSIMAGFLNIFSSLVLFSVFSYAFAGYTNGKVIAPVAIIGLGIFVLVRSFFKKPLES